MSVGLAVMTYAIVIATFGTDVRAIQLTARHPEVLAANLHAVMAARFVLTVPTIVVLGVLSVSGLWEADTALVVQVLLLSVVINIASTLWAAQALEAARSIAAFTFAGQALNLVFVIVAQALGYGLMGFAAARVLADVISVFGLLVWVWQRHGSAPPAGAKLPVAAYLRGSFPFGATQVLRTVALGSDLILADFYAPPYQVGIYAAAYRIFTLLLSVSALYSVVILPSIVRSGTKGQAHLRASLSQRLTRPGLAVAVVLLIGALWSPDALGLIFGREFAAGGIVLDILLVALLANFWSRGYRCALIATGQQVSEMRATFGATAANIAVKLILTPFMGLTGIAIGTLFGEVLQALLVRRIAMRAVAALPA
jgi:O-antigen/teichoic acid export membrane protein